MEKKTTIKSMTGFGRADVERDGRKVSVEIRSVNHRYLECQFRMPQGLLYLEEQLRNLIKTVCQRGRLEIHLSYQEEEAANQREVVLDWKLAESYLQAAKEFQTYHHLDGNITIQDLLRIRELWHVQERSETEEESTSIIIEAFQLALEKLVEMRRIEGEELSRDLSRRLIELGDRLDEIASYTSEVGERYRDRLMSRLAEWLENGALPEERLIAEVALLAEKADISEELTRLESHRKQFEQNLQQTGAIGRKLDFLLQEMNREVNTIGSKANHPQIASLVVECKSVLEKMKEQVQNVE